MTLNCLTDELRSLDFRLSAGQRNVILYLRKFITFAVYIYAGDGLAAVYIKDNTGENMYYILKDHLVSIVGITDEAGNLLEELSYDAYGNRRSPADGSFTNVPLSNIIARGFTGHEHIDEFGLINMNGRVYDPVLGRFLSPDNFVQTPDYTQGLNRYSYAMNNPLKYTDPDGEFIVLDSWVIGFVHGFFSTGSNRWSAGRNEANLRAGNDAAIWEGLFVSDPNKSSGNRIWEVVSRFTWQSPQTLGGFLTTHTSNTILGNVNWVQYQYGSTVVQTEGRWGAVTLGNYIIGDEDIEADANKPLFQHEYGHYIQSQNMGLAYYVRVGIPSISSEGAHDFHPVEQDANRRAFLYFNENVEGFYDTESLDQRGWDWFENPLDPNGTQSRNIVWDYNNPDNLAAINRLTIKAEWYDYFSWYFFPAGPVVVGFFNAYIYNGSTANCVKVSSCHIIFAETKIKKYEK